MPMLAASDPEDMKHTAVFTELPAKMKAFGPSEHPKGLRPWRFRAQAAVFAQLLGLQDPLSHPSGHVAQTALRGLHLLRAPLQAQPFGVAR